MASWQKDSRLKLTKYNVEINGSNFWNFSRMSRVIYSDEALSWFNFDFLSRRTMKSLPNQRQPMERNACLKAKLKFPSVTQNKTIESVLRWYRKGECLFWVFISCRKLPSYVISLTADSPNGPQYSSRKIYHREKATSFRQILRRFIRNNQAKWNIQFRISKGNKASLKLINISNGEVLAKT